MARSSQCRALGRRGFSMVETSLAVVVVAVLLAAVVQTVGAANLGQYKAAEKQRARQLANAMLAEIVAQHYSETAGQGVFGPESGETRPAYDDVDDYNGLSESPPVNKDGSSMNLPQAATWKRTVTISWIDPTTLAAPSTVKETGAKLISVSVYHNNVRILTLTSIRAGNT